MLVPSRRGFLFGLGAAVAAPALVRFDALMPVRTPAIPIRNYVLGPAVSESRANVLCMKGLDGSSWVEVGEVKNIGSLPTMDMLNFDDLSSDRRRILPVSTTPRPSRMRLILTDFEAARHDLENALQENSGRRFRMHVGDENYRVEFDASMLSQTLHVGRHDRVMETEIALEIKRGSIIEESGNEQSPSSPAKTS